MNTVIISAERHDNSTLENKVLTKELQDFLTKKYKLVHPCIGCYTEMESGIRSVEASFMVSLLSTADIHDLYKLAVEFEQESILVVNDITMEASLHLAHDVISLGTFTEVDRYTALMNSAYTFTKDGKYFICFKG